MCMISTINHNATYYDVMGNTYNNFVGFMTNDYIGSLCGVTSYTTYDKYNHLLEDNEMIYIYRHYVLIRDEKGQLKNLPNHYGRYKNKELIIGYSVNKGNFELGEEIIEKRANESRSLMQKYYCMVRYGTEYPEKETKRIHRYVHYRNQQNEKKYKRAIEKGYSGEEFLDKIVSENIFCKYEYLFENGNSETGNESDNWGEPDPIEQNFTIEEILDMPVIGEEIGESKVSADKEQEPNYSDVADNESHDNNNHGIFCITDKDVDLIDIEDLY